MKKIVTVVGARPQFVKAAVLSRLIADQYQSDFTEVLVHTGQHYDENMSEIFFREMRIPEPDVNLEVGSGGHGRMTGRMLEKIENLLIEEEPSLLLTYGDTNSTLAGALAASKRHIPVAHVEAGLRSFNKRMPEEQNRILTDHLASYLFCPTDAAVENLAREGLTAGVYRTGDVMLDASLYYRSLSGENDRRGEGDFVLVTLHRAENTDDPARLAAIVTALNGMHSERFLLPLHPRTAKMMSETGLSFASHIEVIEPIGYFEMLSLESRCRLILTDSGGVQKEAYFFRKPCVTMRDQTEWVETVQAGWNTLVGADPDAIVTAIEERQIPSHYPELYGRGRAGEEILEILKGGAGKRS